MLRSCVLVSDHGIYFYGNINLSTIEDWFQKKNLPPLDREHEIESGASLYPGSATFIDLRKRQRFVRDNEEIIIGICRYNECKHSKELHTEKSMSCSVKDCFCAEYIDEFRSQCKDCGSWEMGCICYAR